MTAVPGNRIITGLWVTAAVLMGILAALLAQGFQDTPRQSPVLTMEATANGAGTVHWSDGAGSDHAEDFIDTWTRTIEPDAATDYWFSVRPDFMSSTTEVTCRLWIGDRLVDESEGTGSSGAARCRI